MEFTSWCHGPRARSAAALALLVVAFFTGLMAAKVASGQDRITLSIGTGFATGVYHPMGGGLASIISRYLPRYQSDVVTTGGSVDNLKLLATDRIAMGFSMADASWDAYTGADKFKDGRLAVRTLVVLYPNRMHIVALDGAGINGVADLKGKRVATGAPGSATEVMAVRLLEASGIDDVRRERLSLEDSVSALKEKKVDALFWVGGAPTPAIAQLAASGVKIRLLDHGDAVPEMNKRFGPLYVRYSIPARSYAGMSRDVNIAGVWNILVASEKMSDQVAYEVVKAIFDHKAELVAAHREAENISLEWQRNNASPIPFHPGAIRYFAEKGVKLK